MLVCRRGTRSLFEKSSAKTLVKKILLWFRSFCSLNFVKSVKNYMTSSIHSSVVLLRPRCHRSVRNAESFGAPSPNASLVTANLFVFLSHHPLQRIIYQTRRLSSLSILPPRISFFCSVVSLVYATQPNCGDGSRIGRSEPYSTFSAPTSLTRNSTISRVVEV